MNKHLIRIVKWLYRHKRTIQLLLLYVNLIRRFIHATLNLATLIVLIIEIL